jgi:aarF domain-containing kinase
MQVQRPGLLPLIALDIFILRNLAKFVRRWKKTNSNLPSLIDEWASSIYREMSYRHELTNAVEFKELFAHYTEVRLQLCAAPIDLGALADCSL